MLLLLLFSFTATAAAQEGCPVETSEDGLLVFPATPAGEIASIECPAGYGGYIMRLCQADGTWRPYSFDASCSNVNECNENAPVPVCDALVTCTDSDGSFECGSCPLGWEGSGLVSEGGCLDIDTVRGYRCSRSIL